ncbi:unnamed protein product [Dibothriocephalus latus]|uniref:Uncharacterized protein n=1 Tax=Dibothriocephalus latus TaxID=60516 RepID=A0A3P7P7E6_DIBLA|nr:unnamed protein product [Dibothriocephalus latus]
MCILRTVLKRKRRMMPMPRRAKTSNSFCCLRIGSSSSG